MRLKLGLLLPATAFLAVSLSSSAFASPINGSFSLESFGGTYMSGNSTTGTALTATGLDFGEALGSAGNGYGTNGAAVVGNATGSFEGLNGATASIADIALGAFANPYTADPFISFGSGNPIVISFSDASYTRSGLGTSVTIAGIATFSDGIAADDSTGTFSLAANSQDGSAADTQFTFTSNVAAPGAVVTPEPSSLALLGTGLVAAASLALRRHNLSV